MTDQHIDNENPIRCKSTDEIMKVMNEDYLRKHKPEKLHIETGTRANLTPIDTKEIDAVLNKDAQEWANNLSEKEVEQATEIIEKRNILEWVKRGLLKPKTLLYGGIGVFLLYIGMKLFGW